MKSNRTNGIIRLSLILLTLIPARHSSGQGNLKLRWFQSAIERPITSVAFSPTHKFYARVTRLIDVGNTDELDIIRTADGSVVRTLLYKYYSGFGSMAFSKDEQSLIVGQGAIRISDGAELRKVDTDDIFHVLWNTQVSEDGKRFAAADTNGRVGVYNAATGAKIAIINGYNSESYYKPFALSIDGETVLQNGFNGYDVWKVSTGEKIATYGQAEIIQLAVSPNGELVAAARKDGQIELRRFSDGVLLRTLAGHFGTIGSIAFSPDSSKLASSSTDQAVKVWDVGNGNLLHTLYGNRDAILEVGFAGNGNMVDSICADNTVTRWSVVDGSQIFARHGHTRRVGKTGFSPDGKIVATASDDGTTVLQRAIDGSAIKTFHSQGAVRDFSFSADGARMATLDTSYSIYQGNDDNFIINNLTDVRIDLWNVVTGELIKTFPVTAGPDTRLVALSPDDSLVATVFDDSVKLIRTADGSIAHTFPLAYNYISTLSFSPNGQSIAFDGDTGEEIHRVSDGAMVRTFPQRYALRFSSDGNTVALATWTDDIEMRDVATGNLIRTFYKDPQLFNNTDDVELLDLVLSPDGSLIAGVTDNIYTMNSAITFWSAQDGVRRRTYKDKREGSIRTLGMLHNLAFSPNGRFLAFTDLRHYGIMTVPSIYSTLLFQNKQSGAVSQWKVKDKALVSSGTVWRGGDKNWQIVGTPDLNGDGVPDVLFQYAGTGKPHAWIMNSDQTAFVSESDLTGNGVTVGALQNWKVVGTPDLNHDGIDDVVLQNSSNGAVYYWIMDGYTVKSEGYLYSGGDANFHVFATPDLNGDGTPDLLLQYGKDGTVARWILSDGGTSIAAMEWVYTTELPNWKAVAAADFYGTGTVQAIFQNQATGRVVIWNLTDGVFSTSGTLSGVTPPSMELKGIVDLDGDGKLDAVLQSKVNGAIYYLGIDGVTAVSPGLIYGRNLVDWSLLSPM